MPKKRKTVLAVVGLAAVFVVAGMLVDWSVTTRQVQRSSEELFLLMTLRRAALESYFETVGAELSFWSSSTDLESLHEAATTAWQEMSDPTGTLQSVYIDNNPFSAGARRNLADAGTKSAYDAAHAQLHDLLWGFVVERGYYDIFVIDLAGNIVYSVEKESDFATNLETGPWRDTGLADVFRGALSVSGDPRPVFSDFENYGPSGGDPALFAGIAMRDDRNVPVGVLALQVPTDRIMDIMHFTAGMGESGETYLVGKDLLMRSDSRFSADSTTLITRVESDTVRRALEGNTGVSFTDDYRGIQVLSAFGPFDLGRIRWAVMAEIDEAEIISNVGDQRGAIPLIGFLLYVLTLFTLWFFRGVDFAFSGLGGDDDGGLDTPDTS